MHELRNAESKGLRRPFGGVPPAQRQPRGQPARLAVPRVAVRGQWEQRAFVLLQGGGRRSHVAGPRNRVRGQHLADDRLKALAAVPSHAPENGVAPVVARKRVPTGNGADIRRMGTRPHIPKRPREQIHRHEGPGQVGVHEAGPPLRMVLDLFLQQTNQMQRSLRMANQNERAARARRVVHELREGAQDVVVREVEGPAHVLRPPLERPRLTLLCQGDQVGQILGQGQDGHLPVQW
mmetsp:Transcript_88601/g.271217  ORF Transcript_88601/g.271217 Transcript_88601/m.271217 type:complete len:236 (+) Transcript_88601:309-1016(+)